MSLRPGLLPGLTTLLTSVCLVFVSDLALASSRTCEYLLTPIQAVTLKSLRQKNTDNLAKEIKAHPMPGFDYIEKEVGNEQVGLIGPRALQQMLGPNTSFIRTPAPNAPMDTAVNLHDEGRSFPLHIDNQWHGVRTSTAVYASMPKTYKPKANHFLVGPEYPVVLVHLHGGGTPTATGKNAMSIGQALAPANIPVLALDLPGHGRATRQIDGFTTFKDQIEWIMDIVDKLVDPNVKIVVSGHSWGGQFTAYWRRLTRDPKYRWRLARLISVSPPVDVSVGGDPKIADDFEKMFERNFKDYKERSAPADFDFMSNSVRNGKTSTIGGIFTGFTQMDYSMPPLTDEDRAQLVREDAFSGDADIITWVGREEAGMKQWGRDMHILTDGMTWKGKQKTGHNVWDLMIDGTKTLFMYDYITKAALEVAGGNMGEDAAAGDQAVKLMDQFLRNYSNFFLFREMIANHDEYVSAANLSKEEREALGKRKTNLENLVRGNADREAYARKESEKRAAAAVESLRAELGIKDTISVDRAKEELALPALTPERQQELEVYLTEAGKVEKELENFQDSVWDADLKDMNGKFGTVLEKEGITDISKYKEKLDELQKKGKNLSKPEEELRKQLSNLHQIYVQKMRDHQGRYGKERDAKLNALSRPAGVTDYKAAQRELKADRSDSRRNALTQYLARIESVQAQARAAVAEESNNLVGFYAQGAVDAAAQQRTDIDALEAFTYCPADDAEACKLANEIKAWTDERTALLKGQNGGAGLDTLEKELRELTAKRTQAAKQWDGVLKKEVEGKDGKKEKMVTSPKIAAYEAEFEAKEAHYRELYLSFEDSSRDWLRELKNTGRLNAANVIAMTPDLKAKREAYYAAKADFEAFRDQGDAIRWSEALAGQLQGPESAVKAAVAAAAEIWGASATEPGEKSLVSRIRVLEEKVEAMRRQESILSQRISRAQWQYSQRMTEKGVKLPFVIQRVAIREALDMNYNDLVARLRDDSTLASAFRATLEKWNTYLATLRTESQTKDAGNY